MKTLRITVEGRVQGIGFRFFTVAEAGKYGIKGTVRNLYDGRVEAVAQGREEALENFKSSLSEGPRMAFVKRVLVDDVPNAPKFKDFKVIY